jgi:hypothetical protein
MLCGVLHAITELIFLYYESKVSMTGFLNYCIVCFNGRYEWIPYQDYLTFESKKLNDKGNVEKIKHKERIFLDFNDVSKEVICNQEL